MAAKPMLGEVELQLVQKIDTEGDQVLAEHGVPGLEGDFPQGLGRCAERLTLNGVLTGPEAGDGLKSLREKFRAAEPVSFVADIATATKVGKVFIEEMGVRDLAGKPERFEYAFALREFLPPPPAQTEEPPPPPPEPDPPPLPTPDVGTLVVEVIVEGSPDLDLSTVRITVEGTTESGSSLARTLQNRSANTWEEQIAPGQYTIRAISNPQGMAPAQIRGGQTTPITITLRSGAVVARQFVVHFRFDRAFVEPCMREVLRRVAARAVSATTEKLVIVGHADKTGPPDYNQSLSERRARAVHAFLTFGRDRTGALSEWNALRQERKAANEKPSVKDNWGVREYQHMLQDLGFYPGAVDGKDGDLTKEAVRAFRCQKGLPPGIATDDPFWEALIADYLAQDRLVVSSDRLLTNCPGENLKWLGCGEEDPVKNVATAHRPSRRVELLFVATNSLPCQVPQPDTFNLPSAGTVNAGWCLGPATGGSRGCFVSPVLVPGSNKPQPCSTSPTGPWCRDPAEPGTLTVKGSIQHEDGRPAANQLFVLTAPNGEFLANEAGTGEPIPAQTDASGNFTFSGKRVGVYHLEVRGQVLVRLAEGSDADVKGNAVCKALSSDSDHLDVVIVNAPLLREIRLPVVAHLMTARGSSGMLHSTIRNESNVRGIFSEANRIWRQSRIRFDVVDVVSRTYTPPPPASPTVSKAEFFFVLAQCSFPNVVNVFFVDDTGNSTEAGFGVSFEDGADPPGCMVETLDDRQSAITLAHELGHFLNLKHPEEEPGATGVFMDRLMQGGLGFDTKLITSEVTAARASRGAQLECVPLRMRVTGATQVNGSRSPDFVAIRQDDGDPITVEAVVPPAILASGTVTMTGGVEVPGFPLRRNVSRTTGGLTPVEAVFTRTNTTPTGSTTETFRHRVRIIVVNFDLVVQGAQRLGPAGSNIFVAQGEPGGVVTVVARLTPASALPACVIDSIVKWEGGRAVLGDPFRRTVSKAGAGETTVSATVATTTRSALIRVIDLAFVTDQAPFDAVLAEVAWESAFRIRADIPAETRDEITVELSSFFVRR